MEVVNAIVLKNARFVERQRVIHLFSLERGFLSMITPSLAGKREGTRVMEVAEVEYAGGTRGGLYSLRSARTTVNTNAISLDVFKMNIALLWGEALCLLLRHEGKNKALYDYLCRSVEYLNAAGDDAANFNLFFFYRLCDLLGLRVDASSYREGYFFDPRQGRFCPSPSPAGGTVGPRAAGIICRLCVDPLSSVGDIPLSRQGRAMLLDVVFSFIGYHLDVNFDTKSIRVIREVFS
ncbi:MAG: DNA repair protein RecO C-terminal domain-containing protein [Odoribacteraceae bacterium]|jgi:DNA repair protein RecO (recombination protein O)|nr:DNA repair protein RecO C-terminal domain-containing protein [Odoribacteraceae bacterium]